MQRQRSYTRHGQIQIRFPRNPIFSYCINDCWFADLHDVTKLNWQNRRKKYLLVVVDALLRYLYCEPLKNKSADTVLEGMKKVVSSAGTAPGRIMVDAGSEFTNNKMRQYLEMEGVQLKIARAPLKASLAELMGKLLKHKIYRYMTHMRTKKCIDHIQEFVDSLNSRPLGCLGGLRPNEVSYGNQTDVYKAQLGRFRGKKNTQFLFNLGDSVRLVNKAETFSKAYWPTYTEETYLIAKQIPSYPQPLYKLSDHLGNPITGRYYTYELHKMLANE